MGKINCFRGVVVDSFREEKGHGRSIENNKPVTGGAIIVFFSMKALERLPNAITSITPSNNIFLLFRPLWPSFFHKSCAGRKPSDKEIDTDDIKTRCTH